MTARRKYKIRADGGGATPPPIEAVPVAAAPAPPAAPQMPPQAEQPDALQAALSAAQHADALQRQHAQRQQAGLQEPEIDPQQRQAIDAHVDAMGLSPHKTRFLKSHPSLLNEPYASLMRHSYMLARAAGLPDDTPVMDQAILTGVMRDIEHHRALSALTSANARPTPENFQMRDDANQGADDLAREAEMYLAEHQVQNPQPATPPAAPRRSIPMSAPVSREVHMAAGGRLSDSRKITLSAEERQVAHLSFKHLTHDEAERAYATNKRRMIDMKARGEIQGDY